MASSLASRSSCSRAVGTSAQVGERLALGHARPRSDGGSPSVPAGLTAMQALDRELDVDTAYGGRFVQSIEGVEGDVSKRRDWFWFLNGIEADLSAADYRLRPGDVEWWDFRSWRASARARGRRRVSRALPARVRRAAATGRRALRARAGQGRPRDRAPVERGLRPAPFGPRPEGRECVLHSKRHATVLGLAARTGRRRRLAGPVRLRRERRRARTQSKALPLPLRGPAERGPGSRPPRFTGRGSADRRPSLVVAAITAGLFALCLKARAAAAGSTSRARSGRRSPSSCSARSSHTTGLTSCGPARRSPWSATST